MERVRLCEYIAIQTCLTTCICKTHLSVCACIFPGTVPDRYRCLHRRMSEGHIHLFQAATPVSMMYGSVAWHFAPIKCLKLAGRDLCFKGSVFHRIIPGFMAQGGDITDGDGTGPSRAATTWSHFEFQLTTRRPASLQSCLNT